MAGCAEYFECFFSILSLATGLGLLSLCVQYSAHDVVDNFVLKRLSCNDFLYCDDYSRVLFGVWLILLKIGIGIGAIHSAVTGLRCVCAFIDNCCCLCLFFLIVICLLLIEVTAILLVHFYKEKGMVELHTILNVTETAAQHNITNDACLMYKTLNDARMCCGNEGNGVPNCILDSCTTHLACPDVLWSATSNEIWAVGLGTFVAMGAQVIALVGSCICYQTGHSEGSERVYKQVRLGGGSTRLVRMY